MRSEGGAGHPKRVRTRVTDKSICDARWVQCIATLPYIPWAIIDRLSFSRFRPIAPTLMTKALQALFASYFGSHYTREANSLLAKSLWSPPMGTSKARSWLFSSHAWWTSPLRQPSRRARWLARTLAGRRSLQTSGRF